MIDRVLVLLGADSSGQEEGPFQGKDRRFPEPY